MVTAVITGSTKGIGRGLAEEFVKRGHNAVICSRSQTDVERVAAEITAIGPGKCSGIACDTTNLQQVQALWDHAKGRFGAIDIWINNAGLASSRHKVHEIPEDLARRLITSNMLGTTFGSQVAINGFRQQGSGALYNVLGGSFDGKRLVPNMGVYSSTKAAIHLLTQYLIEENKGQNITIGMISPGMLSPEEWQNIRPTLNILCDYVETVTPWLTDSILANKESGKRIAWMTGGKILKRFMDAKLLGRKRDLFSRYNL
jgi:short-subunit dehydrogenase